MNEISRQLNIAFKLRKDLKTDEALALYEAIWPNHTEAFSEWDGWSYGHCLQTKRRYKDALELCRTLYPKYPNSEIIAQLYAWNIYYTELAGDKQPANKEIFIKALSAIVRLSPPIKQFSPTVKSIFKLVKFLAEAMQPDWNEIDNWLSKLDKDKLSRDTYTIDVPGKGKKELASELEEWYSWQSKLLLQTKQWQKCIDLCTTALNDINKWHYSNDIWFARRKVAALTQLGHKQQALEILQPLIKRKREWFMLADLAELTVDNEKALQLYIEAALAFGDAAKKIRIFYKMAHLYAAMGQKEASFAHALLVLALRQENRWPVPAELELLIKEQGALPEKMATSFVILQKLKLEWRKLSAGTGEIVGSKQPLRFNGNIERFIVGGSAGFIKPATGSNNIYFLFKNYQGNKEDIKIGLLVSYEVNKDFDKKKNRESEIAVRIKRIV